jgi:hypothetical protein
VIRPGLGPLTPGGAGLRQTILMYKTSKSLLVLGLYFLLGALVFYPAVRIGFLGDFAGDLWGSQGHWLNFAAYQWNFYLPALVLYYGLYKIFHLSPLPYQVVHLSLIVINAWLVYILAQGLRFKPWQCWVAGLMALFNSSGFEAYYWLSTIPKTLATSFGLIALIFLNRFRQQGVLVWGWGYLTMVTLGFAMESTGLILPLLGLILDTYLRSWRVSGQEKASLLSGFRLHLWSFGVAGSFLVMRYLLGIKPYAENLPILNKVITLFRTILATFFHGLQDYLWLAVKGIPLTVGILIFLLAITLLLTLHVKQGVERKRFITLLLLWVAACLPHTIGSHFHSRYLYFPGVFAALVLADVLGSLRLRVYARRVTWLLISLIILGYLAFDFYAFRQTLSSYLMASQIYDVGINKIRTYLPDMPAGTRLVLVDFPDSINLPYSVHPGYRNDYRVLVYRNALPYHLMLLYKRGDVDVTFLTLSFAHDGSFSPLGTPISPEQLAKLLAAPQTVICRYLPGNPEQFVIARGASTGAVSILK